MEKIFTCIKNIGVWHSFEKMKPATIEYSSPSVCLSVCLLVCVHDNSKSNGSIDLKLEHIVVYENSTDEFDIGHCPIKVKVMA